MAHVGKLPKINRFITTHNDKGEAIFSDALPDESKMEPLPDNRAGFALSVSIALLSNQICNTEYPKDRTTFISPKLTSYHST